MSNKASYKKEYVRVVIRKEDEEHIYPLINDVFLRVKTSTGETEKKTFNSLERTNEGGTTIFYTLNYYDESFGNDSPPFSLCALNYDLPHDLEYVPARFTTHGYNVYLNKNALLLQRKRKRLFAEKKVEGFGNFIYSPFLSYHELSYDTEIPDKYKVTEYLYRADYSNKKKLSPYNKISLLLNDSKEKFAQLSEVKSDFAVMYYIYLSGLTDGTYYYFKNSLDLFFKSPPKDAKIQWDDGSVKTLSESFHPFVLTPLGGYVEKSIEPKYITLYIDSLGLMQNPPRELTEVFSVNDRFLVLKDYDFYPHVDKEKTYVEKTLANYHTLNIFLEGATGVIILEGNNKPKDPVRGRRMFYCDVVRAKDPSDSSSVASGFFDPVRGAWRKR